MFKKLLFGLVMCNIALFNLNAMDAINPVENTQNASTQMTETKTQKISQTVKDIDKNQLTIISKVVHEYGYNILSRNDNKMLFESENDKKLGSNGSWWSGYFPSCETVYEAIIASLVFHKANSIIYNPKYPDSDVANHYKKTLSIDVADFTDITIDEHLKELINDVFSKYTHAAEQGYELCWIEDNKLVIALKKEEMSKIMSQYKPFA